MGLSINNEWLGKIGKEILGVSDNFIEALRSSSGIDDQSRVFTYKII